MSEAGLEANCMGCHDRLQEKAVQREIIELSSVCQGCRMSEDQGRLFECGTKIHDSCFSAVH